jgi:hypothetical protein
VSACVYIHCPIANPNTWRVSSDHEPPAGFMRLFALGSITRRTQAAKNPGSDLVPREDIETLLRGGSTAGLTLPSQIERLLQAYARLNAAARDELIRLAEQLA